MNISRHELTALIAQWQSRSDTVVCARELEALLARHPRSFAEIPTIEHRRISARGGRIRMARMTDEERVALARAGGIASRQKRQHS